MRNFSHYLIIFILALAQTTFFPVNLVLGYLLLLFFRQGFRYILPIFVFAALVLAILSSNSLGLTLIVFTTIVGVVGFIKNYLPPAFFIRAAIFVLAFPAYGLLYSFLTRVSHQL